MAQNETQNATHDPIIRDSFVCYRSYFEAIKKVKDPEERLHTYDALMELALNGKRIELKGASDIIIPLIEPQIMANNKKYLNSLNPKKNQKLSKDKAKCKQDESETQGNENVNENVNENDIYVHFDAQSHFEIFWKSYPKKRDKKKAKSKFLKICKNEDIFNQIMRGLEIQKESMQWLKDGGQFIPLPTTWLNGERWNDEVDGITTYSENIYKPLNSQEITKEIFDDE